jgi:hypothetical protein
MPSVKNLRRPPIDYPSGRGTGLPAAGVHAVDRMLGAPPVDFRLQGASGQPSSAADVGYSRATVQRVNKGFEAQKALEDIPEISWLKQNAEGLNSMGLTPRVVVEMFHALNRHTPRNEQERVLIAEMNRRVLGTRRKINSVTRLALLESNTGRHGRIDEFDMGALASAGIEKLSSSLFSRDDADKKRDAAALSVENDEEEIEDALKRSDADLSGDKITRNRLMDVEYQNLVSGVLSCNSTSLEILQTFLAVTGVVGDITIFFGLPIGIASDLVNASINLVCRNYFYAMLDLIAVVPFAGDLSKIFYAKRLTKTLGLKKDMEMLRSASSVENQAEIASRVIDTALSDRTIGVKTSRVILGLRKTFKSAESMAARLTAFLKRVLDRMITYIESVHKSAQDGSISSKALVWMYGKLPLDVLPILKQIREKGIPSLKEFIIDLFGRKQLQRTASGAHLKHGYEETFREEQEEAQPEEETPEAPGPYSQYLRGQRSRFMPTFDDVNNDMIPDDEQPEVIYQFTGGAVPAASPYLRESAKKKRPKSKSRISLAKALAGDDSAVDETSTVMGSLGSPTTPGGGGYVLPIGKKPSGPKRKSLDQLVTGYEFVSGRFPYSR